MHDLLAAASFDAATDRLVFAGGLAASPRLVDWAACAGAACVRSEFDDRVLLFHAALERAEEEREREREREEAGKGLRGFRRGRGRGLRRESLPSPPPPPAGLDSPTTERRAAEALGAEQARWLAACPCLLWLEGKPSLESNGSAPDGLAATAVVAGGIIPGVAIEQQDSATLMALDHIDPDTRAPVSAQAGAGDGDGGACWLARQLARGARELAVSLLRPTDGGAPDPAALFRYPPDHPHHFHRGSGRLRRQRRSIRWAALFEHEQARARRPLTVVHAAPGGRAAMGRFAKGLGGCRRGCGADGAAAAGERRRWRRWLVRLGGGGGDGDNHGGRRASALLLDGAATQHVQARCAS